MIHRIYLCIQWTCIIAFSVTVWSRSAPVRVQTDTLGCFLTIFLWLFYDYAGEDTWRQKGLTDIDVAITDVELFVALWPLNHACFGWSRVCSAQGRFGSNDSFVWDVWAERLFQSFHRIFSNSHWAEKDGASKLWTHFMEQAYQAIKTWKCYSLDWLEEACLVDILRVKHLRMTSSDG